MRQKQVIKSVLPNGLKVVTSYRDSDLFSMGVGIRAGSLFENQNNNGISHMIEHMIFKGTNKRNIDKLNDDIERLAGDMDIYTSYSQTVLTIDTMKKHARDSIEITADMLINASFPEKDFRLEKKVIIEEIKMSKDDPEDCSYLGLYKTAFPEKWFKYHIAGTMKSVKGLKCNMLKEFYKAYYLPNNTVISIVSSFTHEEIVKMVSEFFSEWQKGSIEGISMERVPLKTGRVLRHKKGIGQAHVLYGFDIQHLSKRDEIILSLLNERIGAGPNSVLFKELRDRKGYAYSVYSDMDFIEGLKMFYIYTGISEENLNDTLSIINGVIEKFRNRELIIDKETLSLLKEIFYTNTVIRLESSSHLADYMLDGELNFGNPEEYSEVLSIMENITVDDILRVVDSVLKNPIVHILVPSN